MIRCEVCKDVGMICKTSETSLSTGRYIIENGAYKGRTSEPIEQCPIRIIWEKERNERTKTM